MNKIKIFFSIFFGFFYLSDNAQNYLSFYIIDSTTGSPVPFAFIIDEGNEKGIITDEKGSFILLLSDTNHSFSVTSIGYDTVKFKFNKFSDSMIILPQRPFIMTTINVYGNTCTESFGCSRKKKKFGEQLGGVGMEVAILMANDSHNVGVIKTIRFYIGKIGYPDTKFRAKIYSVDVTNGNPDTLLVMKDIILSADKGGKWVEADISNFNIRIPGKGFFVAMQWLPDSKFYMRESRTAAGHSLGMTKSSACITWIKHMDRWIKRSSIGQTVDCNNAMIGADVSVVCEGGNK